MQKLGAGLVGLVHDKAWPRFPHSRGRQGRVTESNLNQESRAAETAMSGPMTEVMKDMTGRTMQQSFRRSREFTLQRF